jgi:hypothetical protein
VGDFFLTVANPCRRALQLCGQLGDFKHRQHLSGVNSVADVNVNISDVSRDFGVEFHFLKGQEFTGNGECVRKRRASNLHDCSARDRIGGCGP